MTDREIMEQALDALEEINKLSIGENAICLPAEIDEAMDALRERLAQPEQEPVAQVGMYSEVKALKPLPVGTHLYTTPPQRKPLTDEEKDAARWRFLVDNSFDKEGVTQFHVWEHSWEPHSQTGEPTEWKQRVRGPALDRFIARAIEAAHGITGEKT